MAQVKRYKSGDIITFPNQRPSHWNKQGKMDKYLGKTVTLTNVYDMNLTIGLQRLFFDGCEFWMFLSTDLHPERTTLVGTNVTLIRGFRVFTDFGDGFLDICDEDGNCLKVSKNEIHLQNKTINMKAMKDAVLTVAQTLAKAKNTVTTLEIKVELRRDYPYFFWTQDTVSKFMDQLAGDGLFTYTDNGTYRTYSLVGKIVTKPRPKKTLTKSVVAGKGTANTVVNTSKTRVTWGQVLQLAGNPRFQSVILKGGKIVDSLTIKTQKKSPLGYIKPKEGRIQSIVVANTLYNVK